MEFLVLAFSFPNPVAMLYVGLGLGLVIFIHELGHFAVAKWCGVKVERFSIGFGPILWKYTRGETEYALSAIPFGGYVKMLGQDDADPSQLTDTKLSRDPRSYTSKSVPQRMAIISAGVINNMITAVLFFIIAFKFGIEYTPAVVGQVIPGKPAWEAGMRAGDVLTQVGDRVGPNLSFVDVRQVVALSGQNEAITIKGLRDGKPFTVEVRAATGGEIPTIGFSPELGLTLPNPLPDTDGRVTQIGTSAHNAQPAFEGGDRLLAVDGKETENYFQFQDALSRKRAETVTISVRRKGASKDSAPVDIKVGPNHFRTLGLVMDIGQISAIQANSPAAKHGLQVGDKITHVIVDGTEQAIGQNLDPLQLPDFFYSLHGRPITVRVKREIQGTEAKTVDIVLTPDDRPGWVERPLGVVEEAADVPLPVPAIGVAFHVLHHVVKVDPKGPAAGKIQEKDNIQKIEYILPEGVKDEASKIEPLEFKDNSRNWAEAFWKIQSWRMRNVRLHVTSQGSATSRVVDIEPKDDPNWYLPTRGIFMGPLTEIRKADSLSEAVVLGLRHTKSSVVDMWLTIRSLFSGRISPKSLGGPLQIGAVAYDFAKKGLPDLSLFLGLLSVSLAVLNFMPIPVLDGGHFVFLCWEGLRGKPPSERVVIAANYVGLSLVLSLMCWVLGLDIYRLFFSR